MIYFHSKRALVWRFTVADSNTMYFGLRAKCPILTKFGFSQHIFTEVPNINLHGNPSTGSSPYKEKDGRTGVYDEDSGRFSRLCERALDSASRFPQQHMEQSPKLGDSETFRIPATAIYDMTSCNLPDKHRRFRRTFAIRHCVRYRPNEQQVCWYSFGI